MTALIVWASIAAYCVGIILAARWIYADMIRETINMTEQEREHDKLIHGFWAMLTFFSVMWPMAIVLLVCLGLADMFGPWVKEHIGLPLSRIVTGPGKKLLDEHQGKKREEIEESNG